MLLVARAPVAKLETEQPWGPRLGRLGDELRRICASRVVPTGPEASVPPGSNHSLEPGCPAQLSCKCRAHEQGAFPHSAGRSLKSHGSCRHATLGCLLPVSFLSVALPADDSSQGTTEVEGYLGLVRAEE